MPTIYQAGQGLVWHRDSEDNTGSWIYYAHRHWNIEWGGELLLSDSRDVAREYGVYFSSTAGDDGTARATAVAKPSRQQRRQ